jgi:hypothetical protein
MIFPCLVKQGGGELTFNVDPILKESEMVPLFI